MNNSEFYNATNETLTTAIKAMNEALERANALNDDINNPNYTLVYRGRLAEEQVEEKKSITAICDRANARIEKLVADYDLELENAVRMNPADITEDAKLLNCGIVLSAKELEAMFDRNSGNTTMARLVTDYAAQHDIEIDRVFEDPNAELRAIVKQIPTAAKTILKWYNKSNVYDRLLGDGSIIKNALAE